MASSGSSPSETLVTSAEPPLLSATPSSTLESIVRSQSPSHHHCLVCYSDLVAPAITPCDHNEICGVCHLRLRHLHEDRKCPICKQDNEQIIVDDSSDRKTFSEYPLWGNELGSGFVYRESCGMFFPTQYYDQEILPLFGFPCGALNCAFEVDVATKKNPMRSLQDHLRTAHRTTLCQLCVEHHRDFVTRLPRFTPTQLKKHLSHGDGPTSGFKGHPACEFCKPTRFYDLTHLHQHLQRDHEKCHICHQQDKPNQYFNNYRSLQRHFDRQHFLCHDPQCLAARFVVFGNELDLRHHERNVHGGTGGSTKINLEFRVRRSGYDGSGLEHAQQEVPTEADFSYDLDGQAFVPEELPNQGEHADAASLHPLHYQRTQELRAAAAAIRQQQNESTVEAFPSLQTASETSHTAAPLRTGWTSGTTLSRIADTRAVRPEEFPSLPSSTGGAKKKKPPKVKTPSRQFAAMQSAADSGPTWHNPTIKASHVAAAPMASTTTPFLLSTTASLPMNQNRQADLTPDNFPALGGNRTNSKSGASTYAAADSLARKLQQQSLQPQRVAPRVTTAPAAPPKPTNLQSNLAASNFPALGVAVTDKDKSRVQQMKAALGKKRYKELLRNTEAYADGQLDPRAFVDFAAALFDRGYGDADFWEYIPELIQSCPKPSRNQQAMAYLEGVHSNLPALVDQPNDNGGWGGRPNISAEPSMAATAAPASVSRTVAPSGIPVRSSAKVASVPPKVVGNKKSAWGSGPNRAVVADRKAVAGSVAAAAAAEKPQQGTATKFMAKQQKQEKKQTTQTKSNKKKQKNELRDLAFGR